MNEVPQEISKKINSINGHLTKLQNKANRLLCLLKKDPISEIIRLVKKSDSKLDVSDSRDIVQQLYDKFSKELEKADDGNNFITVLANCRAHKLGYDLERTKDANGNLEQKPLQDTIEYNIVDNIVYYIYALSRAAHAIKYYTLETFEQKYNVFINCYKQNEIPLYTLKQRLSYIDETILNETADIKYIIKII